MLAKGPDFYGLEADATIANVLTMIETSMIGFLGITIGSIVIAMYMPLFALIGKMSNQH
jgi:type IV pilus assembly protein PilC